MTPGQLVVKGLTVHYQALRATRTIQRIKTLFTYLDQTNKGTVVELEGNIHRDQA